MRECDDGMGGDEESECVSGLCCVEKKAWAKFVQYSADTSSG